MIVYRLPKIFY